MTEIHDTNDWSARFDLTRDDRDRLTDQLGRAGAPQELSEIALWVIRGRLDDGDDPALAEDIFLKHGEHLLSRLVEMLQSDSRFTNLEGKWSIIDRQAGAESEKQGRADYAQENGVIPHIEQAVATHFAYDPETYEILCRPDQRLSEKKARRLQELSLYTHVVTFPE